MMMSFSDSFAILLRGVFFGFAAGLAVSLALSIPVKKMFSGKGLRLLLCVVVVLTGGIVGIAISLQSAAQQSFTTVVSMIEPDIRVVLQKADIDPDAIPVEDMNTAARVILDEGRQQVTDMAGFLPVGKRIIKSFDRAEQMIADFPVMNQKTATTADFFRDIRDIALRGVRIASFLLIIFAIIATLGLGFLFYLVDSSEKKETAAKKEAAENGELIL